MTQQELTNIQDMEFVLAKLHSVLLNTAEQVIHKDLIKAMKHTDLALEHYQKLVSKG